MTELGAEEEQTSVPDPGEADAARSPQSEAADPTAQTATAEPEAQTEAAAPTARWKLWRHVDLLLAVSLAWLLLFPVAAALVATGEPLQVDAAALPSAGPAGPPVRAMPVFVGARPSDAVLSRPAAMRRALLAAAREVLGPHAGPALVRLALQPGSLRAPGPGGAPPSAETPLRFPAVERLLRRRLAGPLNAGASAAANDLGALLIDAATLPEADDSSGGAFPQAGEVAFAVLDRARAGGACDPQLNLAFELAANDTPRERETELELQRAARDCPGDPTPLWLLGEYQSESAPAPSTGSETPSSEAEAPSAGLETPRAGSKAPSAGPETSAGPGGAQAGPDTQGPFATFALLRRRLPRSAAGWAGAGDAELRVAYETSPQPFTARAHFRRALAFYLGAQRLDPNPEIAAGTARAYAGLRQFSAAAAAQRTAAQGHSDELLLQAWLVEYLEQGHAFGQAAAAAEPLTRAPRLPVGEGRMMPGYPPDVGEASSEEVGGPLSIGAERFTPATINLGDLASATSPAVSYLPFLPVYHEVAGVTGYSRWCPAWSLRRDEILAGRPAAALAGLPERSAESVKPPLECPTTARDLLAGIAAYEAGHRERAEHLVALEPLESGSEEPHGALARLDDARQNLWRFAGNFQRARTAAAEWRAAAPGEAQAFVNAGEIEYFAGRYAPAARLFAHATWLTRTTTAAPTNAQAETLLLRGVMLARLGREAEALRTLEAAEATAESAEGAEQHASGSTETESSEPTGTGTTLVYYALAQTGYEDLAAHHFTVAAEAYEAALERFGASDRPNPPEEHIDPYTATYNDLSLAQAQIGKLHEAAASARMAVAPDPLDPLTRATEGYVLARLGRYREARTALRIAVEQLPSQFSAWSDLGYVEAQLGRRAGAVSDFRHAVGANSRYALGWFNLGVELEREGLLHALYAQGAFGRAIALESSLSARRHQLSLDNHVYLTNLDLSKPLPPNWSFTTNEQQPLTGSLGLVLLFVLALKLGHAFTAGLSGGTNAVQSLLTTVVQAPSQRRRGRAAARRPGRTKARRLLKGLQGCDWLTAAVAVAVSLLVFLLPLLRSDGTNAVEAFLLLVGVGAIITAIWRSRVLLARRQKVKLKQSGWLPAILVGVVTAPLGVPWAPLPVARTEPNAPAVHWIGPILSTTIALLLLLFSALLPVPIARTLAGAALAIAASMLVPVKPLDGGVVAANKVGSGVSIALLGSGLFLLLGLW
jgi:cellulose synthase operon protein C